MYVTFSETVQETQFLYLTCDLPAPPLFPDELQENIIPQVPLFQILNKFNGVQEKEYKTYKDSTMKRFEITRLPPFIILYIKVSVCMCVCMERYISYHTAIPVHHLIYQSKCFNDVSVWKGTYPLTWLPPYIILYIKVSVCICVCMERYISSHMATPLHHLIYQSKCVYVCLYGKVYIPSHGYPRSSSYLSK